MDKNIDELTVTKVFVVVAGSLTRRRYSISPTTWKAKIAFIRCALSKPNDMNQYTRFK